MKNEFIFWEKNREKRLVDIFQSDICHMFTVEKMHLLLSHSFALDFGLTVRITSQLTIVITFFSKVCETSPNKGRIKIKSQILFLVKAEQRKRCDVSLPFTLLPPQYPEPFKIESKGVEFTPTQ